MNAFRWPGVGIWAGIAAAAVVLVTAAAPAYGGIEPTMPGPIGVTNITPSGALIMWEPVVAPEGARVVYLVHLRERLNGVAQPWFPVGETSDTVRRVSGLKPATVYDVKVHAVVNGSPGPFRLRENAFRTQPPAGNRPPVLPCRVVVVGVTTNSVAIAWPPAEDPENDPITYLVALRPRPPELLPVILPWLDPRATTNTFIHWGRLIPGTAYDVKLLAGDGQDFSEPCVREWAFRTLPIPGEVPGMPGPIWATNVTDRAAEIHWGPAAVSNEARVAYGVEIRPRLNTIAIYPPVPVPGWHHVGMTSNTVLRIAGLRPATAYDVRVRAWANGVPGPYRVREEAFCTLPTDENFPPSTPANLRVGEVTPVSVRLKWDPSTDPDGDPITYIVTLRCRTDTNIGGDWLPPQHTMDTTLGWAGLLPDSAYDVKLCATDGKACSPWLVREFALRTLPSADAPGMPGEIAVTNVTAVSALVSWGPVIGPEDVVLVYQLEVRPRFNGVPGAWIGAGTTPATEKRVEGLHPRTVYDVRVRALAGDVAGPWRIREQAFRTGELENLPPGVPERLAAVDVTAHSVRIVWTPAPDPNGDRMLYWVALRLSDGDGSWYPAAATPMLCMSWIDLQPDTSYDVRVRAFDGRLFGPWKEVERAFRTRMEGDPMPSPPGPIAVSNVTFTSASIAWRPAFGPEGVELVYEVQLRPRPEPSEWATMGKTVATGLDVEGLLPGTIYDVRVRAWAGDAAGPWSVRLMAFRTLARTIEPVTGEIAVADGEMIVAVPDDRFREFLVEEAGQIGDWGPSGEAFEEVGGMKRLTVPLGADIRFFRFTPRNVTP